MGEWVIGTTIGDYIGTNCYKDPFPHSLLRTRQSLILFWAVFGFTRLQGLLYLFGFLNFRISWETGFGFLWLHGDAQGLECLWAAGFIFVRMGFTHVVSGLRFIRRVLMHLATKSCCDIAAAREPSADIDVSGLGPLYSALNSRILMIRTPR